MNRLNRVGIVFVACALLYVVVVVGNGGTGPARMGEVRDAVQDHMATEAGTQWTLIPTLWEYDQALVFARLFGLDETAVIPDGDRYSLKVPKESSQIYRALYDAAREQTGRSTGAQERRYILVRFKQDSAGEALPLFAQVFSAQTVRHWERLGVHEFSVAAPEGTALDVGWLQLSPYIEWVEENVTLPPVDSVSAKNLY